MDIRKAPCTQIFNKGCNAALPRMAGQVGFGSPFPAPGINHLLCNAFVIRELFRAIPVKRTHVVIMPAAPMAGGPHIVRKHIKMFLEAGSVVSLFQVHMFHASS